MNEITRRQALMGIGGVAVLAGVCACTRGGTPAPTGTGRIPLRSPSPSGTVQDIALRAHPLGIDLAGRTGTTWAYGDSIPGKPIRAKVGDRLRISVANDLPAATSIHWHGLAIPNDMDGVPGVTMSDIAAGTSFTYDFVVPDAGTYWFHPHSGLQLDTGLYAPLIVEDPNEKADYDLEWIAVLDDWTDGIDRTPDQVMRDLKSGSGYSGGMMGGGMGGMTSDGGDVTYPLYLINGKPVADPDVLTAKPGQRVRIRMINASADTIYTVALGGHTMTVTHTDGFPVVPQACSVLRIGMGERYDVVVTLGDGVFPLVARPAGKSDLARALVRTGGGTAPDASFLPSEVGTDPLTAAALSCEPSAALTTAQTTPAQEIALTGSMNPYVWRINGQAYPFVPPFTAVAGTNTRMQVTNHTMMSHPIHLHGHTFQIGEAGGTGVRKDTVLVPPMTSVNFDVAADNPGKWMLHCHNAYHAEAGMMAVFQYTA